MHRREFVKALAGIPLLGLLVKVPKGEERETVVVAECSEYIDVSASSPWHTMVYEGNRLISDDDRLTWEEAWATGIANCAAQELDHLIING